MAAPSTGAGTLVTKSEQSGHSGYSIWLGEWAGTGDFADGSESSVVDLSTLTTYTSALKIVKGYIIASEGISAKLELEANTADVPIAMHPLAATGRIDFDYTDTPGGGIVQSTGASITADLILTTTSAASGDSVFIYAEWKAY